ncbi:hypothetical protein FRC16_009020 [Serendipita sp. 398]|nr:hypothetical protein FRC16_009020 [Serendipita sp. 398]
MPKPIKVSFHYDIVSTYSYFAFEILLRYEHRWNLDIDLCPTSLATVFKITGTIPPPLASEFKRLYMLKDLERVSNEYQVPLTLGPEFPGNSSKVMRLLRNLKDKLTPDEFKLATRHYFRENFVVNTPISSPAFLTSLLNTTATTANGNVGIRSLSQADLQQAIAESQSNKAIAELMRTEAKHLVDTHGAFGFPWIVLRKPTSVSAAPYASSNEGEETESWFGSDRFANISWW